MSTDRKPLVERLKVEQLPDGSWYEILPVHLGEEGMMIKRMHYGFKYPTKCLGQKCPMCLEVLKDPKGKKKYEAKERAIIVGHVWATDGDMEDYIGVRCIDASPSITNALKQMLYQGLELFAGQHTICLAPTTKVIEEREVTFLDHGSIRIEDNRFDVQESDEDLELINNTVEFHESFPAVPGDKLVAALVSEMTGKPRAAAPGAPAGAKKPFPSKPSTTPAKPAAAPRGMVNAAPTAKDRVKSGLSAL